MRDEVYIVVLNYNDWQDTIVCLTSLYNLDYPYYQVIVCDNHLTGDDVSKFLAWQRGENVLAVKNFWEF